MSQGVLERWLKGWALGTVASAVAVVGVLGGAAPAAGLLLVLGLALVALRQALLGELRGLDALLHRLGGEAASDASETSQVMSVVTSALDARDAALARTDAEMEQLRQVMAHTPSGVLLTNQDGRVRLVNEAFRRMVPVRGPVKDRLPVEAVSLVEVQEAVDDVRLRGSTEDRLAVAGDLDVSVDAVALPDGVLVVVRDVSRYRRADRARTDFVANVSHELRTPIAAIKGFTEMLLDDGEELSDLHQKMVAKIHRNGQRLSDLFDDLLSLYRIETRRRDFPKDRHALRPLLAKACASAADRASSKEQSFSLDCDEQLEVVTNREALETIVANLASNASKYTPEGGSVTVRADRETGVLRVVVEDTGLGIPASQHDRIFERFYRMDDGRSRAVGGTGLGLAIVKHFVLALDGQISVESEPGEGSTFTVVLPEPEERAPAPRWVDTLPGQP